MNKIRDLVPGSKVVTGIVCRMELTYQGFVCKEHIFSDSKLHFLYSDDHSSMLLSVESTETGVNFVDREFSFYDCSSHTR